MNNVLNKIFIKKNVAILIAVLFGLSLIPLLIISFYNHPSADDLTFGAIAHDAWQESHSFVQVFKAAAETSAERYSSWQGTFTAIFIFALQPAVFSENLYFITTFILLFAFCSSTLYLLNTVVRKLMGGSVYDFLLVAIPILFLSIGYLPSLVQGFFWYNGSMYYTFFYSLMIFYIGLMLKQFFVASSVKRRTFRWVLLGILAFLISGGNFITGLLTLLLTLIFLAIGFFKKRKLLIPSSVVFLVLLSGLVISWLAPGNAVRQAYFTERPGIVSTIIRSMENAFIDIQKFLDLKNIIAFLFITPIIYHLVKKLNFSFKKPLIAVISSFLLFAAQYAPTIYAMNWEGEGRVRNVIYYSFFLLILFNIFYLCGWVSNLIRTHKLEPDSQRIFSMLRRYKAYVMTVFLVLFIGAHIGTGLIKANSTVICAYDLVNGKAAEYSKEIQERVDMYLDESAKEITVTRLKVKPYALFFSDVSEDPNDFRNEGIREFYDKDVVIVK